MPVAPRIDFTSYPYDSGFSKHAVLTERGIVQYRRPSSPSTDIAFTSRDGEDRVLDGGFSLAFGILYEREGAATVQVDDPTKLWLFLPRDQNRSIIQTPMHSGAATTQVTAALGSAVTYISDVGVGLDYGVGYGYIAAASATGAKVYRWDRSGEVPSGSTTLPLTLIIDDADYDWAWVDIDTSGDIWVGGTGPGGPGGSLVATVARYDSAGSQLQVEAITSARTGYSDASGSVAAHTYTEAMAAWGDTLIFSVFNQSNSGPADFVAWFALDTSGVITEITDRVYVNGEVWADYMVSTDGFGWAEYSQMQIIGDRVLVGTTKVPTTLVGLLSIQGRGQALAGPSAQRFHAVIQQKSGL